MKPTQIKKLQTRSRQLRARVIAPNTLVVTSRSNPYSQHIVTVEMAGNETIRARCTCPWAQNGGYGCSHVLAALAQLAATKQRTISFWTDLADAQRQKHRILRLEGRGQDGDIFITSRPTSRSA
ncbi:MAG: SWIM zinc finger family protein [Chloroflexi bacterium]|nr:SWIM zinc finger family protein [Chloroflexota bacterium]